MVKNVSQLMSSQTIFYIKKTMQYIKKRLLRTENTIFVRRIQFLFFFICKIPTILRRKTEHKNSFAAKQDCVFFKFRVSFNLSKSISIFFWLPIEYQHIHSILKKLILLCYFWFNLFTDVLINTLHKWSLIHWYSQSLIVFRKFVTGPYIFLKVKLYLHEITIQNTGHIAEIYKHKEDP